MPECLSNGTTKRRAASDPARRALFFLFLPLLRHSGTSALRHFCYMGCAPASLFAYRFVAKAWIDITIIEPARNTSTASAIINV